MRIFVAGATGAIGRVLVPLLVTAGHDVVGATRSESGVWQLQTQGAGAVRLDVFEREAVREAVATARPDVVIHQLTALADGSPVDNARIRKEGTRNLVDAAVAAGVRKVIAQSISWAYEPGGMPADETVPLDVHAPEPRKTSIEGVVALENTVAEMDEYVVLRYGTLYGPHTWFAPNGRMAEALRAGTLPANDGISSFVHVKDAARAALLALEWPSGPVNIVDDEPAAARDWAPALAKALGEPVPDPVGGSAAWERGAINTKARGRGWAPEYPTWRTGFAQQG